MITQLQYTNGMYQTPFLSSRSRTFRYPSCAFYIKFLRVVFRSYVETRRGIYDGDRWSFSSLAILRALESVGVSFEITGIHSIQAVEGPCVFIANHMSTLETMILPGIIQPLKEVTFIVKRSLLEYPVFKHILSTRNPIVVTRDNPREDLKRVLQYGFEKIQAGMSIIVFPQTTRTLNLDPEQFNTIGIKLAKRAQVPVIPIGLVSDAWGLGWPIKEFGRIDPKKSVHFSFGAPFSIQGRGDIEHQQVIEFIRASIEEVRNRNR